MAATTNDNNTHSPPVAESEASPGYDKMSMEIGGEQDAYDYVVNDNGYDGSEDGHLTAKERVLYSRLLKGCCVCITVLFIVAVLLGVQGIEDKEWTELEAEDELQVPILETNDGYRIYSCPTIRSKAENDVGVALDHYKRGAQDLADYFYLRRQQAHIPFQDIRYDGYPVSFTSMKETLRPWKVKYFCPYLKSGDSIYESASGSGMNLLLTLQILKLECNIHDLTIAGNDYIEQNVKNSIYLHSVIEPSMSRSSFFCVADSASSSTEHNHNPFAISGHVPEKSFHLVYTGYIEPIIDPIGITGADDNLPLLDQTLYIVDMLCDFDNIHTKMESWWAAQRIATEYQQAQEEWFAKWVHELIRIAKPGAPILIENVPPRLCSHFTDYTSGVAKDFWTRGVETYGWDVDVDSIQTVDMESPFQFRYSVFMKRTLYSEDDIILL
uniref:Uncharacterized protein n=1 Tax=Attheya septentrionalis TaxID=420275 RepID=A0A7S2U5Y6_9STRA